MKDQDRIAGKNMKYIGALDVGTTTVRFHIIDEEANTIASSAEKVRYVYYQLSLKINEEI